jgi:sarcosine oxidase subunit alpha
VRAYVGESVAAALHADGTRVLARSLKYHRPRAFFCLEGHCSGCLMRIDGVPNVRACMQPCRDGLELSGQNSYPSADLDVLGVVDWLFPKGMNHHTMMTGNPLLNLVANKVVRQLSGLGELPDRPAERIPAAVRESPDVLVIGGGPAGLNAAAEAARAGARTVLIDEQVRPGGALLCDPRNGLERAAAYERDATGAGVSIRASCTAIGFYAEDAIPCLAVATPAGLSLFTPRRFVYATGGHAVNRLFVNNDRPGVVAARAAGRLLVSHGIKPGERVCLLGEHDDPYADALEGALDAVGCDVLRVLEPDERVLGVHGRSWVSGVDTVDARGNKQHRECDLVAVSAAPAPASEAARQHGCQVEFHAQAGGFRIRTDSSGRTNIADVFACGDVCGQLGPDRAAASGARVGRAAAESLSEAPGGAGRPGGAGEGEAGA